MTTVKYNLTVNVVDEVSNLLDNIPIKLLNSSRSIITTKNSNNGSVVFNNLKSGKYYIRINKQSGYESFEDKSIIMDGDDEITVTLVTQ